jgi:hypothetical protein
VTPAAVPVAAAVIMAVPNYKLETTHDFIEGQAEASFLSGLYFFRKKTHKQKYKQIFKYGDD